MRRTVLSLLLLGVWGVTPGVAQEPSPPLRIGAHIAGNTANGPFDLVRAGGYLLIPLGKRFDAYPAISRFFDGAEWEVSAALRYRLFSSQSGMSPWYVGGGWAKVNFGPNDNTYDVLLTGWEVSMGRLHPFVEIQALDLIDRLASSNGGDFAIQVHSGLSWAIR